jgi:hypothetical protein
MLTSMANAANASYQISEQIWSSASADGFTEGQPDNSATPLMWAMAQYVRLALDISAGKVVEQPAAACALFSCTTSGGGGTGTYRQTVNVIVPVNTDASGATVYLAGDLSALGTGESDWAANGVAMTRVSLTEWTTTISATTSGAALSYKFDLGGSWSNVEKSSSCADISNRALTVSGDTTTVQVADWGGPNTCGTSTAVITVNVPSSTPSGDTVYLSGTYDGLGTGIPSSADWLATDYPMIQTGTDTWQLAISGVPNGETFSYKFTLGSWSTAEETSSWGTVANRGWVFSTAGGYSGTDTVAAWQGVGSC